CSRGGDAGYAGNTVVCERDCDQADAEALGIAVIARHRASSPKSEKQKHFSQRPQRNREVADLAEIRPSWLISNGTRAAMPGVFRCLQFMVNVFFSCALLSGYGKKHRHHLTLGKCQSRSRAMTAITRDHSDSMGVSAPWQATPDWWRALRWRAPEARTPGAALCGKPGCWRCRWPAQSRARG